mmetsp:Transcript_137293/g.382974  ORF Transcript_137293/g.382974 Transcript_137293/m.382974 type:complete len:209 (+) Transcript_137293:389-1015(+)
MRRPQPFAGSSSSCFAPRSHRCQPRGAGLTAAYHNPDCCSQAKQLMGSAWRRNRPQRHLSPPVQSELVNPQLALAQHAWSVRPQQASGRPARQVRASGGRPGLTAALGLQAGVHGSARCSGLGKHACGAGCAASPSACAAHSSRTAQSQGNSRSPGRVPTPPYPQRPLPWIAPPPWWPHWHPAESRSLALAASAQLHPCRGKCGHLEL